MKQTKYGYCSPIEIEIFGDLDKQLKAKDVPKRGRPIFVRKKKRKRHRFDDEAWKTKHWVHRRRGCEVHKNSD